MTNLIHRTRLLWLVLLSCLIGGCGFHLQGKMSLSPPLQRMFLETSDPYGYFSRILREYLKISGVTLTESVESARTTLVILQDTTSQELLSVSASQQTRQYNLRVTISFMIRARDGETILPTQTLTDTRVMTVQSNQILGSSNEANLYFQQMRRTLATALMNRIASKEVRALSLQLTS